MVYTQMVYTHQHEFDETYRRLWALTLLLAMNAQSPHSGRWVATFEYGPPGGQGRGQRHKASKCKTPHRVGTSQQRTPVLLHTSISSSAILSRTLCLKFASLVTALDISAIYIASQSQWMHFNAASSRMVQS